MSQERPRTKESDSKPGKIDPPELKVACKISQQTTENPQPVQGVNQQNMNIRTQSNQTE